MIFLNGVWHGLKVVCIALYWLLSFCLVWAGFALMGTAPRWGWANFAVVLVLFAARGFSRRYVSPGVGYVVSVGLIFIYFAVAATLTGYTGA